MPTAVRRPLCKPTSMTGWWRPSTAPSSWPLRPTAACSSPPSPARCGCTRTGSCCRPRRWISPARFAQSPSRACSGWRWTRTSTANQLRLPLLHLQEVRRVPDWTIRPTPTTRSTGYRASSCPATPSTLRARWCSWTTSLLRHGNHNAGDLQLRQGRLPLRQVGDGGCDYASNSGCAGQNDASRDPHILLGKILRITRDGGIPCDQPLHGHRQRPLQPHRPHRRRQELPGDVRLGLEATPSASPSTRTPRARASSSTTSASADGRR